MVKYMKNMINDKRQLQRLRNLREMPSEPIAFDVPKRKTRIIQTHRIRWGNYFSKLQNGGVVQDGPINHCSILSSLAQPLLN
jgi:hypothetical protein